MEDGEERRGEKGVAGEEKRRSRSVMQQEHQTRRGDDGAKNCDVCLIDAYSTLVQKNLGVD